MRHVTARLFFASLCPMLCAAAVAGCSEKTSAPPPVTMTTMIPGSGPMAGGTAVTITGTNFVEVSVVTIGTGVLQNLSVVSSTEITGQTPTSTATGAMNVVVYTSGAGHGTCTGCFTYYPPPTVASISSASGPVAGGTAVAISGTNFPPTVDSARLGTGRVGSLVRVSGTQLTGTTPAAGAAGAVDVVVYTASAGNATCTGCFTYFPALTVQGVGPASGPMAGGTAVTITGTNFPPTVDSVRVATARLAGLVRASATQLTGTTPAGSAAGAMDVVVYTASAGNGTCAGCFTYFPPVTVQSIGPASGPVAGGTAVTITGTNFPPTVDSVRLGAGLLAGLVRASATQLTGTTPVDSGATGAVDVVVYSTSAGNGTCAGCFTYYSPVTVTGVSPKFGAPAGGTAVTISGTNFVNVTAVTIGGGALQNLSVVNAIQITGQTAASASNGVKDVVVSSSTNGTGTCAGCFTYNPPVTVTGVSPNMGDVGGGTALTITGTYFVNVTGVTINYTAVPNPTVVSSTQITVQTSGTSEGYVRASDVTVQSSSNGNGTCTGCFTYYEWGTLAAGGSHTCGVTGAPYTDPPNSAGIAACWGTGGDGQLGDGSLANVTTPALVVAGGIRFTSLTAGTYHTCGLTSGGIAYCWGFNFYGELGDGSTTNRTTPVAVAGGHTFVSLTAGTYHTCGVASGGAAYCWGYNGFGQLGDGSTTNRTSPVAVAGGITFASVAAGGSHSCGVSSGGAASCWGHNGWGQLGTVAAIGQCSPSGFAYPCSPTPVSVTGGLTFASLTTGDYHTCGVTTAGVAECWGYNISGQLGDATYTNRAAPVPVATGSNPLTGLTAGSEYTCGLTSLGRPMCWGAANLGQLGAGGTTGANVPVFVSAPAGVSFASLSAGGGQTCGVTSVRVHAYCWGNNPTGQVGDGSTTNRLTPVTVAPIP